MLVYIYIYVYSNLPGRKPLERMLVYIYIYVYSNLPGRKPLERMLVREAEQGVSRLVRARG
jgi:hypothetical protein